MDFITENILTMLKDGSLDILSDRLHFTSAGNLKQFLGYMENHNRRMVMQMLEQKDIVRIMLSESLKSNGKYHDGIFTFLSMGRESEDNPFFTVISKVDNDFTIESDMTLFCFFFNIIPILNFAAYLDEYQRVSGLEKNRLIDMFISSCSHLAKASILDTDILLSSRHSDTYPKEDSL